jgi:prevent-host-death family protein
MRSSASTGSYMGQRESIKSISYLKSNTASLVRGVFEDGRPVTITQNGDAKVVVMDVGMYHQWKSALALMKLIALGESGVQAGRTTSTEETFRRARTAVARSDQSG